MIGVIKVKLFINFYGSELNGLQVTIAQVITFLNICELAFSLAFRQLLYKPLANDDKDEILNIYHGAVKIFRRAGMIVIGASLLVACVYPFFAVSPLNYYQTVGVFLLLALPYGISYFLMGPNLVIIADQKEYKINLLIQSMSILRMVFMVLAIQLKMDFFWILIIEGCNILISNTGARFIALKAYPWLKNKPSNLSDTSFAHHAKYAIIQRLSELAITQTDNIVISGIMGYAMTSVYSTFSYLTDNISKITQSMVTSPMNSFGNLFNDKNGNVYSVFTEFFNFASFVATIVSVVIFVVMPQFVHIWMNRPEYTVTVMMALAFAFNIFYMTIRQSIIIPRDANGLYVDAKNNAYLLAVTKIVLSIILVSKLGLLGVILATTIAYWTIDFFYNPVLVYHKVFNLPVWRYYAMVLSRLAVGIVIGLVSYVLWNNCLGYVNGGVSHLVISILLLGVAVVIVTTIIYSISYKSFRMLVSRFVNILRRKRENRKA